MVTKISRQWKNKDGSISKRWGVDYMAQGEQKKEYFKSKEERQSRYVELVNQEQEYGDILINKNLTFSELYENFMKKHANISTICKDSTRRSYKTAYDAHFNDIIGHIPGQKFNNTIMTSIVEELTDRGLSPKSINNMIVLIKTIFNFSVDDNKLYKNPIAKFKKLKLYKNNVRALTVNEIKILLAKAKEMADDTLSLKDAHDILATLILSGVRRGELIAIEWSRVNFEKNTIYINQSEYRGKLTTPKTPNSVREVDMCEDLRSILWNRYKNRKSDKWVFPAPEGGMWSGSNISHRVFNPIREKLNLAPFRLHDLRHTFVSILIDRGENPKYISQQVGHSSVKVTLDIYCHLFEKVEKREHKLNGLLKGVVQTVQTLKDQIENMEKAIKDLSEVPDGVYKSYMNFKAEYDLWQMKLEKEKAKHREYGNLKLVAG